MGNFIKINAIKMTLLHQYQSPQVSPCLPFKLLQTAYCTNHVTTSRKRVRTHTAHVFKTREPAPHTCQMSADSLPVSRTPYNDCQRLLLVCQWFIWPNVTIQTFFIFLFVLVELHVCVVYLPRKSEYSCFLSMQLDGVAVGFGYGVRIAFPIL